MERKKLIEIIVPPSPAVINRNNLVEISDDTVSTCSNSSSVSSLSSQGLSKVPKITSGFSGTSLITNPIERAKQLVKSSEDEAEETPLLSFVDSEEDKPRIQNTEKSVHLFETSVLSSKRDILPRKSESNGEPIEAYASAREQDFDTIFGNSAGNIVSRSNMTPISKISCAQVSTPKELVLAAYSQDEDIFFGDSADDKGSNIQKRKSKGNDRKIKKLKLEKRVDVGKNDHFDSDNVNLVPSKSKHIVLDDESPRIKTAKNNIIFSDTDSPIKPKKLAKEKKISIISISSSDSDKITIKSKQKHLNSSYSYLEPIQVTKVEDSESSIEIPSVKRNKIKKLHLPSRILRSNNEEPDILPLPDSDSELPNFKKRVRTKNLKRKREHKKSEPSSGESEPDSDLESIISIFSNSSTNSIISGPRREMLYCSICAEYQPYDNFSRVEQTEPRYGQEHRFCLRHHGKDNDVLNYAEMIELKALRQKLNMEDFDKKYNIELDFSDITSGSE